VIEEDPAGKRLLGRPKLRWEDGVKIKVEKSPVPIREKQRRIGIGGKFIVDSMAETKKRKKEESYILLTYFNIF
jgi:hypothetical protein